jgi:hypothetical protein
MTPTRAVRSGGREVESWSTLARLLRVPSGRERLAFIGDAPEDAERFAELGRFAEARWVRAGSAEPATGSVASGLFFGGDAFRKLRPAIPRASAPPGRFGSSSRRSAA